MTIGFPEKGTCSFSIQWRVKTGSNFRYIRTLRATLIIPPAPHQKSPYASFLSTVSSHSLTSSMPESRESRPLVGIP